MTSAASATVRNRTSASRPSECVVSTTTQRYRYGCVRALLSGGQRPREEGEVGGALGEAAHQVPVPAVAVRQVDPDRVPPLRQPALLPPPHPVEHLELELGR